VSPRRWRKLRALKLRHPRKSLRSPASAEGAPNSATHADLSHPDSEKIKLKHLYVYPGCSNHTYNNNMINRYNILLSDKLRSYKITLGSERRLQLSSSRNHHTDRASTGTTRGEAGMASFLFFLLVPLISTPTFSST
jgi:hypothetical protein